MGSRVRATGQTLSRQIAPIGLGRYGIDTVVWCRFHIGKDVSFWHFYSCALITDDATVALSRCRALRIEDALECRLLFDESIHSSRQLVTPELQKVSIAFSRPESRVGRHTLATDCLLSLFFPKHVLDIIRYKQLREVARSNTRPRLSARVWEDVGNEVIRAR